jgi:hypothetical protein
VDALAKTPQSGFNIAAPIPRSKERDGHAAIDRFAGVRGTIERRAEGNAIIAGHWLNVNLIKESGVHELAVGRAVECYTSGQRDATQAGFLSEVGANV